MCLGRYLGTGPEFWMTLQSAYDVATVNREKGAVIENEVRRHVLIRGAAVRALAARTSVAVGGVVSEPVMVNDVRSPEGAHVPLSVIAPSPLRSLRRSTPAGSSGRCGSYSPADRCSPAAPAAPQGARRLSPA